VLSGSRIQQTILSGGIIMRSIITLALVLVGTSAFASTSNYSCAELKSLVKSSKSGLVMQVNGSSEVVYPTSKGCFDQGIFHSKYITVEAADGSCTAGLVCDIYFGGM